MARGRTGPVVSLFAFQDIITAVSGILIVVVLLLALELVEQPQAAASSTDHQAESIRNALDSAEEERDRLRSEIANAAEFTREAAATSVSALKNEVAELAAMRSRLKQRLPEIRLEVTEIEEAQALRLRRRMLQVLLRQKARPQVPVASLRRLPQPTE